MAARPRTHNINVPNLYRKLDKRNGKTYYQYKHPITGTFVSLGTDEVKATAAATATATATATEANQMLAQEQLHHINRVLEENTTIIKDKGVLLSEFCERYLKMQQDKFKAGDIAQNTLNQKTYCTSILSSRLGGIRIKEVTVREVALVLQETIDQGKISQANLLRSEWSQVFDWAQHYGEVDSGFNPPRSTKMPKRKHKRSRLSMENAKIILEYVKHHATPHLRNAVYLAITTGQRVGDISKMKFSDVRDGHLFVEQQKSGGKTKVAIPLELTNPLINKSLGEIIQACRDNVVSKHMVHYSVRTSRSQVGAQIKPSVISAHFTQMIKLSEIQYTNKNCPTFHELRSIAERSYSEIGINTQSLLGHKTSTMTDKYHDNRGEEFTYIATKSG